MANAQTAEARSARVSRTAHGGVAPSITYTKLFWLFVAGSLLGVVIEGCFCAVVKGRWETHVVSVWGPFCILYGIGAAGFYAGTVLLWNKNIVWRFLFFASAAAVVELLCGLLLEYGLHMRAWNYSWQVLNFRGHISLQMTCAWGAVGTAFSYLVPHLEKVLSKMQNRFWQIACILLTIFMGIDLALTAVCIVRWKDRHFGNPPRNVVERIIDRKYDDAFMKNRFVEWRFLS